jgi:predicted O-methyltransferase YrrM
MGAASERAAAMRREMRLLLSLSALPARVARFFWRAWRHARRTGDRFSLVSPARPAELAALLALARGRTTVVELGTGTAWTAISFALAEPACRVISCDPCVRVEREAYLDLAGLPVRERIELREEPDGAGPRAGDGPVQLLFIDSSHEREPTVAAFLAWRGALAPGALVIFHDHGNPDYPGVREAVEDLGLAGWETGGLFVWRAP